MPGYFIFVHDVVCADVESDVVDSVQYVSDINKAAMLSSLLKLPDPGAYFLL